jgi:hypothetical protein
MNFNIFRNPFIDAQVGMLMDSFDKALYSQTEEHWRNICADEIRELYKDKNLKIDTLKAYVDAETTVRLSRGR